MNLSKEEIIHLLTKEDGNSLFEKANKVREKNVGNSVHLRALIEFSNICKNNCLYCGLRKDNLEIKRYRLTKDDILNDVKKAVDLGFKTIVLQSGEDMYFNQKRICEIIEAIKKYDVALTLSIGERTYQEYKAFKNAGADRYLIRIETTNKDLYHNLDPDMSWDNRYKCLLNLRELGYELGSGIMVGLPNQTIESIADDLLFLKHINVDMAGIGPFIPHPKTPLANKKGGTLDLSLRTMAIMRLLLEDINIPATTAMEALHPEGQIKALESGANVIMPNMTNLGYRKLYDLYPNKENTIKPLDLLSQKLQSINRTISKDYGFRKNLIY